MKNSFRENFFKVKTSIKKIWDNIRELKEIAFFQRLTLLFLSLISPCLIFAQTAMAGDYSQGTQAFAQVTEEIVKYVPLVVQLCYAIAGVVGVVGAISVYIAMNNDEQDVKKKIMMVVGACIFLIAAAQALPLFFGISS